MAEYKRQSAPEGEVWEDRYQRCSRCNSVNDLRTARRGGRVAPNFGNTAQTTYTLSGQTVTVYTPNPEQDGCILCGSPEWDGWAEPDAMVGRAP